MVEPAQPVEPSRPVKPGRPPAEAYPITARVLGVRPGRYGRRPPGQDEDDARRRGETKFDPPGTLVLTLLVPEGRRLPPDLGSGEYEIVLSIRKA